MIQRVLIANRGEVAVRIAQAVAESGLRSVAVHAEDEPDAPHAAAADEAHALSGSGARAYLDIDQLVRVARERGCDALHPGYGFLSENPALARACAAAGIRFVGPDPETLALFGDKGRARALARDCGVALLPGTEGPTSLEAALAFFDGLGDGGAMMIKAIAGGGGRGMRVVSSADAVAEAWARCRSEAQAAFGHPEVYVERLLRRARHIEIQVVGDGRSFTHLHERECSVQRRQQKLIEIAPGPSLAPRLRTALTDAALRLAAAARYRGLGTFEFLVDADAEADGAGGAADWAFMEANPRLQVEHTVTEAVTGIDLVRTQLRIAGGATLDELGLRQADIAPPRGHAIQLRINAETLDAQGTARPSGGTVSVFEVPTGPGIRVDTAAHAGYRPNPNYDSLLVKLVCHAGGTWQDAVAKAARALSQLHVEGVRTNAPLLAAVLRRPEFLAGEIHTRFVEEHLERLLADTTPVAARRVAGRPPVDTDDTDGSADAGPPAPAGTVAFPSPLPGTVVSIEVAEGDRVRRGQTVAVLEAMKMEHAIGAPQAGIVRKLNLALKQTIGEGHALVYVEPVEEADADDEKHLALDLERIPPALQESIDRHAKLLDAHRPAAVERRRATGQRTARANVDDLCDPDSFAEYGGLVIAGRRRVKSEQELIDTTPADGVITGIGGVNGALFGEERARTAVMAYDYTVFAGTQGNMNHRKSDRLFQLALEARLPLVLFAEGGGGRPGDTDAVYAAGIHSPTFGHFALLSGQVPLVGIASGRCFAGNAALLGCCDVVIATRNANIGMGGPAMVEGGGLGVYRPEEIGPVEVQVPNGTVDVLVDDEAGAVATARRYLSYFQGRLPHWEAADQRLLRQLIPENRLRSYDIRAVIHTLADTGSVLELRRAFGRGIVTAFARIEGRPVGLIANDSRHLGGAIDADAADKASRFMQLCDAYGLPLVSLADTPGFMVGPEVEKSAQVRHVCRMFVNAASLTVPWLTVIVRKGYGLGVMAMAAGSSHRTLLTVAWPNAELGGMGLEGAVRLGARRELEAIADPARREARFQELLAQYHQKGRAVSVASFQEIDDVIDPAQTRWWILRGLQSAAASGAARPITPTRRRFVDTW